MKKISTLFVRNPEDRRHVINQVTSGCEWVVAGEGVPTQKYDGTCVRLDDDGQWWARREVKPGKQPPADYIPVETDEVTGKTVGWEPIGQSAFAKFHAEAVRNGDDTEEGYSWPVGTYELIGPKVNGNPEKMVEHGLVLHSYAEVLAGVPRDFDGLAKYLADFEGEGIVWHHPDGRMAKLKKRDFA